MLPDLKPVSAAPAPCKICGGVARLYGVVDLHKGCDRLPTSGVPIYYRRCAACDFLFSDTFDCWSDEQFRARIYNDDYPEIDLDYKGPRPHSNADSVVRMWGKYKAEMRILDFGGGNDLFCARLRANGFPVAVTYDPMVPAHARRPDRKFDLVTCFETLEHVPDPVASAALMVESVAEPGFILYSTVVQPADFSNQGLAWWYVAPRNGHISLFSKRALSALWSQHGYKTFSFNDGMHLAFRTLPTFLAHLQSRADSVCIENNTVQVAKSATNAISVSGG
jgi:2-polyprenyl-6-hydroxyphenyl methylase/3-demethylubiquinone-9 3-methyltransferase